MSLFIPPPSAGNPPWVNDHIWLDIQRAGGPQNTGEAEGSPPSSQGSSEGTLDNLIGINVGRQGGGFDPALVTVQAWVCNPSAGVGASTKNLKSANGQSGLTAHFGPNSVDFSSVQTAHIDWFPTDTEVTVNGGHICIAANVYDSDSDGAALTSGPINLGDPHTAQRNISIILAPPGFAEPAQQQFFFFLPEAELLPDDVEELLVRVDPVPEERALTPVIQEQLLATGFVDLVGGEPVPEAKLPAECLDEPRQRIRLRGGGELVLTGGDVRIHPTEEIIERVFLSSQKHEEVTDRYAELRVVPRRGRAHPLSAHFVIEPQGKPGGVQEVDLVLRSDKDQLLGGIRVVLLSALRERIATTASSG
jgi:hypothetical protein